jgi:hypothetical protein
MTSAKKKTLIGAVLVFACCSLAVVLARPGWIGLGPERAVRKRAEGYWDARVAKDLRGLAPFVHPLQRAIQENSILETDSYEITRVQVDGDVAIVGIKAKYRLKQPLVRNIDRELLHDDKWVRYKGEWYHAPHPVGLGEILEQGLGKWKPPKEPPPSPTDSRSDSPAR